MKSDRIKCIGGPAHGTEVDYTASHLKIMTPGNIKYDFKESNPMGQVETKTTIYKRMEIAGEDYVFPFMVPEHFTADDAIQELIGRA